MDIMEAMLARHSVRQYEEASLTAGEKEALSREIAICNEEGDLHIQLVTDEPLAFNSKMAHYGKFSGVTNYIALIGKKTADLDEKCGYYGERLVLFAQQIGLNTCWVALTYKKIAEAYQIAPGEKLTLVISIGKGKNQGTAHRSKALQDVAEYAGEMPLWFKKGAEAALLAPTAVNQQKFFFSGGGSEVQAKTKSGICAKIDLGIAKYHFEIGAGKENFCWK